MVEAKMFDMPWMIEFIDNSTGEIFYGIGLDNEIICGCCGTILGLNDVIITKFIPWVDISKTIQEERVY